LHPPPHTLAGVYLPKEREEKNEKEKWPSPKLGFFGGVKKLLIDFWN
jgi:hypothetical protein